MISSCFNVQLWAKVPSVSDVYNFTPLVFSEVSHSRYLNRLTTHLKMFTKKKHLLREANNNWKRLFFFFFTCISFSFWLQLPLYWFCCFCVVFQAFRVYYRCVYSCGNKRSNNSCLFKWTCLITPLPGSCAWQFMKPSNGNWSRPKDSTAVSVSVSDEWLAVSMSNIYENPGWDSEGLKTGSPSSSFWPFDLLVTESLCSL